MPNEISPDDIVRTHAEGAANRRPPLLILEPLLSFLDAHELGAGEPVIHPIGNGLSNATYLFDRGGTRFVLRRPPRPPVPPSANDMLREARVLAGLSGLARVPRVLAVCADALVIGAPFYVMAEVEGMVVTSYLPPDLDTPEQRRRVSEELVDALVEIHDVDWTATDLDGFGRREGYLERQLHRFGELWAYNKTRELQPVDAAALWLTDNIPQSPPSSLVHGDYRLGNVLYAPEAPALLNAVLDWELSTIGDPLADLGYMCASYVEADDPSLGQWEHSGITRQPGFLTRAELVARYAERSGRPMGNLRWYQAFALWKSAVFMEGNYRRATFGMSDNPYLMGYANGVVAFAERAMAVIHDGDRA
jgi:aminoglycoside phosphotransferase (APT) family kinase protein